MSTERPRLVRRVAIVSAIAAAIGGAAAAMFAGVLAGRLVASHEDEMVLAAAVELADEVDEELPRTSDDDEEDTDIERYADGRPILASVLLHELQDVKQPLATASVVADGTAVAGDRSLPLVAEGRCITDEHGGLARRVCAAALDDGRLVLLGVSAEDERERWTLMAWALVAGALVGAAIGGVVSHRSAAWALAPVIELRDRVRRIDAESPRAELLDPTAPHAEVEDLRRAIVQLVERLGASLSHAQSFAALAAHELRTPLSLLAGELELMIESTPHERADRESLTRLHRLVQSLIVLAQRLLVLAGPGRIPAEQGEPIDLADVVDAVRAGLPQASGDRLRVRVEDDVVVRGDHELLRSLLHNAVENALKFSDASVEVTVSSRDEAVIDVVDRGPGIPAEDRARVFAAFYRGPGARAGGPPGHGIGLALIAHVAEAHGGRAELLDCPSGTHLQVRLPRWSA